MAKSRRSPIVRGVQDVRTSLSALDLALGRLVPMLSQAPTNGSEPKKGATRRARLSPQRRAALKLQGRYMGFMRQLKPKQKAQVRKMKEAKGVRAAIARARSLAAV